MGSFSPARITRWVWIPLEGQSIPGAAVKPCPLGRGKRGGCCSCGQHLPSHEAPSAFPPKLSLSILPQERGFLGCVSRKRIPVPVCPSSQGVVPPFCPVAALPALPDAMLQEGTQPSPSVSSAGAGMRSLDGKNASDIPDWSELLKDVATLGLVSWAAKSPSTAPEGSGTSGTSVWSNPGQLRAWRSHL